MKLFRALEIQEDRLPTAGNTLLKFCSSFKDPQCGCHCIESGNLCLIPSAVAKIAPVAGAKKSKSAQKTKVTV